MNLKTADDVYIDLKLQFLGCTSTLTICDGFKSHVFQLQLHDGKNHHMFRIWRSSIRFLLAIFKGTLTICDSSIPLFAAETLYIYDSEIIEFSSCLIFILFLEKDHHQVDHFIWISPVFSAELLERLAQDDIACELAPGGYNSSVLSWRGAEVLRPLFEALTPAVLRDMATPVDLDPGSPWSYENYPGWLLTDYTIYLFNT